MECGWWKRGGWKGGEKRVQEGQRQRRCAAAWGNAVPTSVLLPASCTCAPQVEPPVQEAGEAHGAAAAGGAAGPATPPQLRQSQSVVARLLSRLSPPGLPRLSPPGTPRSPPLLQRLLSPRKHAVGPPHCLLLRRPAKRRCNPATRPPKLQRSYPPTRPAHVHLHRPRAALHLPC